MGDRVLLTDERRDVLAGEYEGSGAALRNQKSRIRQSGDTALRELIEIADSPHVDQMEVFDQKLVAELVHTLVKPNWEHHYTEAEPGPGQHGSTKERTDEWRAYRSGLLLALAEVVINEPDPEKDPRPY
jgi:hypothetical protein